MSNQGGTIEGALGLRARAGSREALLRAAFDLVDTSPGMRVRERSLCWQTEGEPTPTAELAVAIRIEAPLDIAGLEAAAAALQDRLCPPELGFDALRIELLWAHDPAGVPTVAANPPPDLEPDRPPLPDGQIHLHPDVLTRASACTPLSEVAGHARDPVSTRFASEFLYTLPAPYVERPEPLEPAFTSERRVIHGGWVDSLIARDRADLLAAAAEAFVGAPASAMPIGPTTLLADERADARVAVTLPADASLDERVLRWLRAIEQVVIGDQLMVRRVVVIDDGPLAIHGLLFGRRSDSSSRPGDRADWSSRPGDRADWSSRPGDRADWSSRPGDRADWPISLGQPDSASVTVDPATGECRAELTVLAR